jgi:hypothetical protein
VETIPFPVTMEHFRCAAAMTDSEFQFVRIIVSERIGVNVKKAGISSPISGSWSLSKPLDLRSSPSSEGDSIWLEIEDRDHRRRFLWIETGIVRMRDKFHCEWRFINKLSRKGPGYRRGIGGSRWDNHAYESGNGYHRIAKSLNWINRTVDQRRTSFGASIFDGPNDVHIEPWPSHISTCSRIIRILQFFPTLYNILFVISTVVWLNLDKRRSPPWWSWFNWPRHFWRKVDQRAILRPPAAAERDADWKFSGCSEDIGIFRFMRSKRVVRMNRRRFPRFSVLE